MLRAQAAEAEPEPTPEPDDDEPEATPEPDAVEQTKAKQATQFVEDLEVHKATDAAKLVTGGKARVPDALLIDKLKVSDVVEYLMDHFQLGTVGEVVEACQAWRPHVPKLRDLPDATFKSRVSNTYEIVVDRRESERGKPGAA